MDTQETTLTHVLPSAEAIAAARARIFPSLPDAGLGEASVQEHLQNELAPGFNECSRSANFYGFVTGGVTPAAAHADNLVTRYDQNVQVHLPNDTIATDVEDRAASMVCELLDLKPEDWPHRTFTTGATASNILGIACGREYVIREAGKRLGKDVSVAEDGLLAAMQGASINRIQILTTVPHSSLAKSASIIGLGRSNLIDVSQPSHPHLFDLPLLESHLSTPNTASIVCISCSEVNTGHFATTSQTMTQIRSLCTTHSAWLHIDAAFGLLARLLPPENPTYNPLLSGVSGLDLADSITGDAHKLLNVPYDCGIFLSRHLPLASTVFQNPNAAYLSSSSSASTVPSPLNIRLENSARFRALPVYATLSAYGRQGHREMLERQIALARGIARYIVSSPRFTLLPAFPSAVSIDERLAEIYIIVLFRAVDAEVNRELVKRINGTRRIFVSGTKWEGEAATRFAVANWRVDVQRDLQIVKGVLEEVVKD